MILFPSWFFSLLVVGGIVLASAGAILLLGLLLRDFLRRTLW